MSKLNLVGLVVAGTVGLGCGGPEKPKPTLQAELAGAPAWAKGSCLAGLPDHKGLCGVGSVQGMTNVSLARSAAEGRARADLARGLQMGVKAMLREYQTATRSDVAGEQHVEDLSKQITDGALSSARLQDTWVSDTGTFWALVVLDTAAFTDSLNSMKQLDDEVRAAIVQRAAKTLRELDASPEP